LTRVPGSLLALPLLGIAWLLPASDAGLWLRLAAATAVVLLPGAFVARLVRAPGTSATIACALVLLAVSLAVTFAVHASLWLAIGLYFGVGAVVFTLHFLPRFGAVPGTVRRPVGPWIAAAFGLAFGLLLWRLEVVGHGDALFHLARVRKLDDFGSLSLRTADEFRDGGLHPGYAFPLWHGFLALVARLAAVDPTDVVHHEASLLCPFAFAVAYEAGAAVFRSAWAGAATAVAQVALIGLAPGHGGAYVSLALPGAAAWQVLAPAVVALVFTEGRAAAVTAGAAVLALAFVHITYALFVALLLAGFLVARALIEPRRAAAAAARLGLAFVPLLGVVAWLAPVAREAAGQTPSRAEVCRALRRYSLEIHGSCRGHYHLVPELVARRGSVAVAALTLLPLAAFAARRRWSALVLGGSLALLTLELVPFLFPKFAAVVSISQARRSAGFIPQALSLAGAAAILARAGPILVAAAAVAGVVLQFVYPGGFGAELPSAPSWPTWIAFGGGAAALVGAATYLRRRDPADRSGLVSAVAVTAFAVPVAVHGFTHWTTAVTPDPYALTPGLVRYLNAHVRERSVVFSNLETSYRIAAFAPVYVAASPPAHVADTHANRPYARRRDVITFLRTGDVAIPRRYGATWLVIDRSRPHATIGAGVVYRDRRYAVYKL
jgi:hypothetical protein